MKLLRYIAFPLMPFYFAVTWMRNILYDLGVKPSKSYELPLICVGNLSTGGTGKTPMVEYLIRLLKTDYKLATLSRGYGRKTKGFHMGSETASAETLGDEPFQFYSKFSNEIHVAVDGNRQNGISRLLALKSTPEVVILDDAYQHRKVKAGLNVLLTTYANPYVDDWILPTGDLRESREGAKRAQIIVVTKCPDDLSDKKKNNIIDKIKPKNDQSVFFSTISYGKAVISKNKELELNILPKFTLVTGIANAASLVRCLTEKELNFSHMEYKDHYRFSELDIEEIAKNDLIVTTEKDYMRLKDYEVLNDKLYYLPIETQIDESEVFDGLIKKFASNLN